MRLGKEGEVGARRHLVPAGPSPTAHRSKEALPLDRRRETI